MYVMKYPEHILVVLACTLAGGVEQIPTPDWFKSSHVDAREEPTCGPGSAWLECHSLDAHVLPVHIFSPWIFTVVLLLILGMPTILVRTKHKEKSLGHLAWIYLQCLALAYSSIFVTDHPSLMFSFTLHSCVRILLRMPVTNKLVGGRLWWGLRYAGVVVLLGWEILAGVPVSIVRWNQSGAKDLSCAYLAHLAGCLVPDLIVFALEVVGQTVSCLLAGEE